MREHEYSLERQDVDVLVLGAGLAGLRAAWAAKEANPSLRVAVAAPKAGPAGSSFANLHDRLGMQVCFSDHDCETMHREALALAAPGEADPGLTALLARESLARFREMQDLGVPFACDEDGGPTRMAGCFAPGTRRAVHFLGLGRTFRAFQTRLVALGVEFWNGWLARDLLLDSGRVAGALLQDVNDPGRMRVPRTGAVVLALGGPAPLFAHSQAGPGNPGISLGLLARAGAALANQPYLQIMWARVRDRRFWRAQNLALPGCTVQAPTNGPVRAPQRLRDLAGHRATHCPFGYGLPDAALDLFLVRHMDPLGHVLVHDPVDGTQRVAPMAHAANGGARIDPMGRTTVPGLLACGECATGMHGANRMGGAMVTATQVFGRRAGLGAVRDAADAPPVQETVLEEAARACVAGTANDAEERAATRHWLGWELQRHIIMRERRGLSLLQRTLETRHGRSADWLARLMLESAAALFPLPQAIAETPREPEAAGVAAG